MTKPFETETVVASGFKTVGELIEALQKLDPKMHVILLDFQNDTQNINEIAKPLAVKMWEDEFGRLCYIDTVEFRTLKCLMCANEGELTHGICSECIKETRSRH